MCCHKANPSGASIRICVCKKRASAYSRRVANPVDEPACGMYKACRYGDNMFYRCIRVTSSLSVFTRLYIKTKLQPACICKAATEKIGGLIVNEISRIDRSGG